MKQIKPTKYCLLAASLGLLGVITAPAATTITYFGFSEGTQINEWRTSTTTKTMDIDGNNVYGTFGSVQWNVGSTNEVSAGNPGWSFVGGASQFGGYVTQLDRNTGGADVGASIMLTTFTFKLEGTAATYLDQTVRVGIMADMLNSGEWAADQNKGYRLTGPGGGDSGIINLRSLGAADGVPEMYFFDITGVNPGDQFTLSALNNVNGSGVTQEGYLGPVSFDIVPEPSAALLGSLGMLALLRRRR